jgi:hypothetical protein
MSPNLVRLSGLAAILRGVLGVLLTPVLAYLWATDSDKYGYFGRAYFLVFLGCLSGLAGLYGGRTSCPDLWPAAHRRGTGGPRVVSPAHTRRHHAVVLLRLGGAGLPVVDGEGSLSQVIPGQDDHEKETATARAYVYCHSWIPACAGMTYAGGSRRALRPGTTYLSI